MSRRISENRSGDRPSLYIYTLAQWASGVLKTGENPPTPFTTAQRETSEVVCSASVPPRWRDGIGTASVIGRYLSGGSGLERFAHQIASKQCINRCGAFTDHSNPHTEVPARLPFLSRLRVSCNAKPLGKYSSRSSLWWFTSSPLYHPTENWGRSMTRGYQHVNYTSTAKPIQSGHPAMMWIS